MKSRPALLSVVVALFGLLIPVGALADEVWTTLSVDDGLLHRTIHSLSPTGSGGLLVGTSGGLNYWDGRHLIGYSAGNGLPQGHVTAAAESKGRVWVGSWGGGLAFRDGDRWKRYRAADSSLPGDWIVDLATTQEGIWIATYGDGLAHLLDDRWTLYTRANSGLPSDWLTCLLADERGGVWVGTERAGLSHMDGEGLWRHYGLPSVGLVGALTEVTALARYGQGVWAGTRRGVAILDPQGMCWRLLGPADGLPGKHVTALAADRDGGIWIGTSEGLAFWDAGRITTFTLREGLLHDAVNALTVDATGRLWVGSFVRGLTTLGELERPQVERRPVVLVHGWRGPDSDSLEESEFRHLARWLREDGFKPYYATGIGPEKTLHANAARLRDVIARARQETGADGVYVIAFSMGGLNARAYLETTLYQQDVLRAFILGAPHRGVHLWLPFLLWEHLAWTDEPSALELLPLHAALFNETHFNAWGTPYTIVAGDAQSENLPTIFGELPPSDGLVSAWSGLGVKGPHVDHHVTEDIHAWGDETILLDIPSLLLPRTTYDAHIRPHLFGVADAEETRPPGVLGRGRLGGDPCYTRPTMEPRTALRTGSIAPGETLALAPIPVDTKGRVRFYLRWKGDPLEMSLRDPQGHTIDAGQSEDDENVEHLELGFADFASYVLTDTLPGPWQMIITASEENDEPSQYAAYASLRSPVRLTASADRDWVSSGEWVTITATIHDPDGLTSISEVSVDIYSPSRHRERILLGPSIEDGGGKRDRSLSYQRSHRLSPESGYCILMIRALGTRGDHALERSESLVIGVNGSRARLTGPYALEPGSRDRRGRIESLRATVGMQVLEEGDYLLSVTLSDAQERQITTVAHPAHLAAGDHMVRIPIPARALVASEMDGPYRVEQVTLLDISGAGILLDEDRDVATSAVLRHSDFAEARRNLSVSDS